MRRLVVLGGGTAGTMVANKLRRRLDRARWEIIIVDHDDRHLYQPGFLFLPFGTYRSSEVVKQRRRFFPAGVEFVLGDIESVDADADVVLLAGRRLPVMTLWSSRPGRGHALIRRQECLASSGGSQSSTYTLDGATRSPALTRTRRGYWWCMSPICRSAPGRSAQFTFAEAYFRRRGMRDRVELTYATPLPGAFTAHRPAHLG
jgi:sulfide:quinone oxidoreductase